jgi:MFS superfamily sulfate permease-like transporter
MASDAPVLAGLIAAVIGGIVAGALGGSALQVSGPAAGLTVIVAGLVAEFGWAVTCAITVCAGIMQILLGVSRVAPRHWPFRPSGNQTNFDRELVGQGTANVVAGAVGGPPVTGVIVRSSTNVNAGEISPASSPVVIPSIFDARSRGRRADGGKLADSNAPLLLGV